MKTRFASLLMSALISTSAALADDIRIGIPAYGGSGCPQGTASATLTDDGKTLSILFDAYQVEAGGNTGKRIDRKSCNLAIPVHVPQGFSVAVMQVDYRGFNALPGGALSQFNVEYFFAGYQGPRFSRRFTGPLNSDYEINNRIDAAGYVWSACGTDVMLRTNSNMQVMTNNRMDQSLATVDSADVNASLVYHLQWKRCGDGGFGGGGPIHGPIPFFQ